MTDTPTPMTDTEILEKVTDVMEGGNYYLNIPDLEKTIKLARQSERERMYKELDELVKEKGKDSYYSMSDAKHYVSLAIEDLQQLKKAIRGSS